MRTAAVTAALSALLLAACASVPAAPEDPTLALQNPEVTRTVAENGDVIEEYRVNGRLQVVKVTPGRGPVYYLMDSDRDGNPDENVPAVYWKLFEWN
ncbi:DUF2782 domain-containing protein [Lysobacter sp. GX 14042]|uniref:DUF2782 domain-containing protein n=1 Tax=Lysobacter sp. GX 14042 TaxID=2907155 RepID=UPI001F2D7B20|nr:DUF2782 domain-containing protein [Lysobacter sp. GX 14042]MCE7032129.1 DUF2782 domain-containing protein [Lysobacter sp. GX 14042]